MTLTLHKESLQKVFYYASTYFTVVEQQAENLLSFVIEGKHTIYHQHPQSTASDDISKINEEKVLNMVVVVDESSTGYYNSQKDDLPGEDLPSPYLHSRCFLCFPLAFPDCQLL